MARRIVAIAITGILASVTPTALAAGSPATDPVAQPRKVYPYVVGGRPDATTITFRHTPHPEFSVYDLDGRLVSSTPIPNRPYVWDPRLEGDVLGSDLTGTDGRVFRVCVSRHGRDSTRNAYCAKVRVVHVREDVDHSATSLGRDFFGKTVDGGCTVRRGDRAALIECGPGATAVLRYELERPALTTEQTIVPPALFDWKGRYYRWGDGLSLERTGRGAIVTASARFWGRLTSITKSWTVRTEY